MLRVIGYLFVGLLALIISAVIFLAFVFDWNSLSGYASRKASDASGREVAITDGIHIDWGWPHTHISLRGITVANMDGGSDPQMVKLPAGEIGTDVSQLLRFNLAFTEIVLNQPDVLLEKTTKGDANWELGENPEGAAVSAVAPDERSEFPAIGKILIRDGRLRYIDPTKDTNIELTISNFKGEAKEAQALVMTGKGTYAKQPMSIKVDGGTLSQLQENKDPYPLKAKLIAGPTSITIDGAVDDVIQLKGLALKTTLKGDNMADLFPLIGVALPPSPPYNVTGNLGYNRGDERWDFKQFSGRMGDSDLGGNLSFTTKGERPKLTGEFISKKLDMNDLAGLIGAPPSTKPGETASEEQRAEAAALDESPYLIPDVPLDISRISAMDADVTFKGQRVINQDVPLDNFLMHVVLEDRLLNVKPVQFGTADGDIRAVINVNARTEPMQIDMDTAFRRLSLARLFDNVSEKLGTNNVAKGHIGGLAKLQGSGKSMREFLSSSNGTIGIGMDGGEFSNLLMELMGLDIGQSISLFAGKDKAVNVNCVVADFAVKDGQMQSNALVIDTSDTNVQGSGTIDFKDERMAITLKPQPKDPSILSAKSDLHINGTLKNPSFGIDTVDMTARIAAAAALAIATPIASILAFVEPGLGKDSPCYALMSNMKSHVGDKKVAPLVPKNPTPAVPENKRQ
jgi:uncharacterized protein involved in outer membrane biogenesis